MCLAYTCTYMYMYMCAFFTGMFLLTCLGLVGAGYVILGGTVLHVCIILSPSMVQWNLSNQDTASCPSYIEKCTKQPLKYGHLFNRILHVVLRVSVIERFHCTCKAIQYFHRGLVENCTKTLQLFKNKTILFFVYSIHPQVSEGIRCWNIWTVDVQFCNRCHHGLLHPVCLALMQCLLHLW